jgi:hypothetical protein
MNKDVSKFPKVRLELTKEVKASGDTRLNCRNEVAQIAICGGRELESVEANVIQGLVINAERLVAVFNQLMDGERGVLWLIRAKEIIKLNTALARKL